MGNWNPHGSYRSPFFDTRISGIDIGAGLDRADPFVTAPVSFTGMLIDAEPYGAYSSQLFFDDMSFGIDGGCCIYGERGTRFHDHFVNFSANPSNNMIAGVASVMWQTGFAKDAGLRIDAHDSKALQTLLARMGDDDVLGVLVRFATYRTVYYDDPTLANGAPATKAAALALQAKIAAGGFQPNPARSLLVGTVGLWRRGEMMTEASDRALTSTMAPIPGQKPPSQRGPAVGTIFARVHDGRLTLDLSNAIPCADRASDKIDLGTLKVTAADPAPAVAIVDVAQIPLGQYDRAAYEATSGIVDIPLATGQTLDGLDLRVAGSDGTVYATEMALRALPTTPNLYLDEGDSTAVDVWVYERGKPASAGVKVTMSELGAPQATSASATTDASGRVRFPLHGTQGEVTGLVFQAGPDPVLPVTNDAFNPLVYTYMYLRVLPADHDIGSLPPTWENVHGHVLANWEAMAPCMDNWLKLGDEAQVRRYASLIRQLTDPSRFESYRYMPITRDMTRGQRALLYKFLGVQDATLATPPDAPKSDFGRLSRSMRSG